MDGDNLDELTERIVGPGGHLQRRPAVLASDVEESGDGNSGDSEDDTGSEQRDDTEEDEEGASEDLEDRSGSEDSEEEAAEAAAADTQKTGLDTDGMLSSDSEVESCPICLNAFRDQAVGTPETCAHYFCLDCILEWSKNANSCPVDRTVFQCICVRAQFGGKVLRKVPMGTTKAASDAEEEDPTFCEVCGRSDREDRLLLCDGCDAGYHMECLDPPLQEVPVDEWFCPECAAPSASSDPGLISEEEVSLLLADVVPTTSRLRPTSSRTRAIARTRQSERVRATVNRNRITTARRVQHIPSYLMSSLLEETIEAVASGLSTAVYQRPLTPRAPGRRKRKTGRRTKALGGKKAPPAKAATRNRSSRVRSRRRRVKRRKGRGLKVRHEITTRTRLARTLGLRKPMLGASLPSVHKPADPSLGLMRADIGAASLSLFGDPHELDPFDSSEEPDSPASPLSAKRRVLSQSALRSHQPVARPVAMALSRRAAPAPTAVPEPPVEAAAVPDLVGSILCGQSFLMMSGRDVIIHRDGSLSAKRAAPAALPRNSLSRATGPEDCRPEGGQPPVLSLEGRPAGSGSESSAFLPWCSGPGPAPAAAPAPTAPVHTLRPALRLAPRAPPAARPVHASASRGAPPRLHGDSSLAPSPSSMPPKVSTKDTCSPLGRPGLGQSLKPALRRRDISELPRIPKIKREGGGGHGVMAPGGGPGVELPSACISRLTGREGPTQPGRGPSIEAEPSRQGPREAQPSAPGSQGSPAALVGSARGKGVGSAFESFRINIPGNAAHSSPHPSPGFCNTFRPVDNKVQRKENPSPLFSLKKPKQLKSEIYDPFNPTGSDSSSPSSSPERQGAGLLPSEITRTISVQGPSAAACQTVRCVTSYTVRSAFRPEATSARDGAASDQDREVPGTPCEDPAAPRRSTFFHTEARTVTCVTVVGHDAPPSPDALPPSTHRVVELRSPSPTRSDASSCGQKGTQRAEATATAKEPRRTRSRSHSKSHSRERSSRSASPPAGHARKQRPRARTRRSSSEGSSSRERARRKRAKGQERKRGLGHGRRRSRSASAGSSSHEGRKKRARRSASRSRARDGSPASSLERTHRHRRRRERSRERTERKEGASRPRGRRRSRERSKWRARSPCPEHRAQRQLRSRERLPWTRSHSPDRKPPAKEASPKPMPDAPASDRELLVGSPIPAQTEGPAAAPPEEVPAAALSEVPAEAPPGPECPTRVALDDLDYGDSVEAGHVFEDFTDSVFQLDDMSSPPSPESSDSSPERAPPPPAPGPAPPAPVRSCEPSLDPSRALAAIQREVSLLHSDEQALPPTEAPPDQGPLGQEATTESRAAGVLPTRREFGPRASEGFEPEETAPSAPLLRSKAPVKRVTWNLREEAGRAPTEDPAPRESSGSSPTLGGWGNVQPAVGGALPGKTLTQAWDPCWHPRSFLCLPGAPVHRPQRPRDVTWGAEGVGPVAAAFSQVPPFELLPPSQAFPEPVFPDTDGAQVYSPALPVAMALPLPVSGLPCVPASQPSIQFLLQSSLPLAGCAGSQALAPVPATLTATPEPVAPAPTTNDSEEKGAAPKPAGEKVKTEEYLKKLHMQERAVEEVKLAIKPFYQKREITKEEYKDILRKAVQKICHSKSGEINPMKVANLVKAYVDKYRHMRRHKKAGPEEGPPPQEVEG